jgi:hypothetical protein
VSGGLILAIAVIVAAAVIFFFVRRYLRGRPTHLRLPAMTSPEDVQTMPAAAEVEQEPDTATVHRGLRAALDALDDEREPGDAVVKAWLGLQAAAEESGVERRSAETPTEFTARVITRVQADAHAATALVDVYQGVRFGGHPITSAEVRAARSAVHALLASWHDPVLGRKQ